MSMSKCFSRNLILALLVGSTLIGCGPRGETKTLAEVLAIAQEEFNAQVANGEQVKDQMSSIQANLGTLINEQSDRTALSRAATELSGSIATLTSRAGYTSRPAFTELAAQYRELRADAAAGTAQMNRLKLMAARTYSALASELATTKFAVMPLNPTESK